MNRPDDPPDDLTAAEQRLHEHLDVLRQDTPQTSALTARRVVRAARWQRALRRPLLAIGALSATVAHALGLLLKPPADRR